MPAERQELMALTEVLCYVCGEVVGVIDWPPVEVQKMPWMMHVACLPDSAVREPDAR